MQSVIPMEPLHLTMASSLWFSSREDAQREARNCSTQRNPLHVVKFDRRKPANLKLYPLPPNCS